MSPRRVKAHSVQNENSKPNQLKTQHARSIQTIFTANQARSMYAQDWYPKPRTLAMTMAVAVAVGVIAAMASRAARGICTGVLASFYAGVVVLVFGIFDKRILDVVFSLRSDCIERPIRTAQCLVAQAVPECWKEEDMANACNIEKE
eukprot:TRINITY_DN4768_c0_g1_i1.p1 TRINITY_DN4768_c0_g1~~TRINITY_DN4768_c0_g1_i1.p1  ORF type:complete len:147 (+),score=10.60 TRINITY_DN4768_c0_g1_i1:173-613(+)